MDNYIKLATSKRTYMFILDKSSLEEILNDSGDLLITGVLKDSEEYKAEIYTADEGMIIDTNINRELFKCLKKLATAARQTP